MTSHQESEAFDAYDKEQIKESEITINQNHTMNENTPINTPVISDSFGAIQEYGEVKLLEFYHRMDEDEQDRFCRLYVDHCIRHTRMVREVIHCPELVDDLIQESILPEQLI